MSNAEFEQAEALARHSGIPLSQCPTCLTKKIEVASGVWGWENGKYRYRGAEYECNCQEQMNLRKHYLLANIGEQYMRLNWDDYTGSEDIKSQVRLYVEKWDNLRLQGMGVEFASPLLGVGKTFAATYIGKELIKKGEKVHFVPFLDVISMYQREDPAEAEKLRTVTVLILDEVVPPWTTAQGQLFSSEFERLIRHRTNFNLPTIMTTNLEPEALHTHYPRTYSLLAAKQCRIIMTGKDARQGLIETENLELAVNDEVRPIT